MILVIVAAILLTLATLVFIALPLVRPSGAQPPPSDSASADLLSRRDRIYGELRELDFDARVGKVTGADYVEARDRLESDAARVLRALHSEGHVDESDDQTSTLVPSAAVGCPECGAVIADGARFCSTCGTPVIAEVRQ